MGHFTISSEFSKSTNVAIPTNLKFGINKLRFMRWYISIWPRSFTTEIGDLEWVIGAPKLNTAIFSPKLLNLHIMGRCYGWSGAKGAILPRSMGVDSCYGRQFKIAGDTLSVALPRLERVETISGINGRTWYWSWFLQSYEYFFLNVHSHVAGSASEPPLPGQVNVSKTNSSRWRCASHRVWTQFGNLVKFGLTVDTLRTWQTILLLFWKNINPMQSVSVRRNFEESHELDRDRIRTSCCPNGVWYNDANDCETLDSSTAYIAKTCDTTLQNGDVWFFNNDDPNDIRTLDEMIDVYHDTVGNGMHDGTWFCDWQRWSREPDSCGWYRDFGDWIRSCMTRLTSNDQWTRIVEWNVQLRHHCSRNPLILINVSSRGHYSRSTCSIIFSSPALRLRSRTAIGNRRICVNQQLAQELKLSVTAASAPKLSQIAFFAPC